MMQGIGSVAIPRIVVSVVSHGQEQLLKPLLNDFRRLEHQAIHAVMVTHNQVPFEAAKNPLPPSEAIAFREHVADKPRGFASNHNAAFALLDREFQLNENDWFLVMNPDIRLKVHNLSGLRLHHDQQSGVVAPLVLDEEDRPSDAARELPSPANLLKRYVLGRSASSEPLWFAGMFLAVRVACWRALKGFDESYYLYCEDTDFCLRARLAGWSIRHETSYAVRHSAQRASHRSLRHFLWHTKSLMRLWRSDPYRSAKARL
ncbi:MAG: glycosyl transferase [Betaproteobacteria bacterium]|nr:glycosyl transferase [Betaproteobacteria bacterium]